MAMAIVTNEQSTANMDYLRRLLSQRQPGLSAALELAVDLLGQELHRAETLRHIGASEDACPVALRRCRRRRTLPGALSSGVAARGAKSRCPLTRH